MKIGRTLTNHAGERVVTREETAGRTYSAGAGAPQVRYVAPAQLEKQIGLEQFTWRVRKLFEFWHSKYGR